MMNVRAQFRNTKENSLRETQAKKTVTPESTGSIDKIAHFHDHPLEFPYFASLYTLLPKIKIYSSTWLLRDILKLSFKFLFCQLSHLLAKVVFTIIACIWDCRLPSFVNRPLLWCSFFLPNGAVKKS